MAAKITGGGCSWRRFYRKRTPSRFRLNSVRASQSMDDMDTVYKQLGLFSLKKKIKDVVLKAEMLAPDALELEEEQWIKQEETMRYYDLWDDPAKSDEILLKLADREKAVDILKDLKYKAEEAKLIIQLGEMDAIDYSLFEQAYDSSLDVSRSLDHYEMSKILRDQYESEGACMIIKSGSQDIKSQMWTEQVVSMYIKWAEKLGQNARVAEKSSSLSSKSGVNSATIEFEFEFAYGYLLGERGLHRLITTSKEECSATVDIIPLFLRASPDFEVKDEDLIVSYPAKENKQENKQVELKDEDLMVSIQHIPSGITVESSGERNRFANRIKALNRLKAKLLVIAKEQKISDVNKINRNNILEETRRYVAKGHKMVVDTKTGLEILDLKSVLDGNIGPLLGAHIGMRSSIDAI
ncbi:PREDICTED: peptide chain release factor PrfB3, chloroplastic-like [Camelina sativa]|uniref:Peptide chain release factor PrfB3, chloroplastic-like n=1 Tax=Camelina sativa TaxID=90675 RepID=A0ABM0ZIT6_CAMSA|nr:PREDICTED: peptide chain release factor PrfB3, chloroplastic-like [Camelina sativa]